MQVLALVLAEHAVGLVLTLLDADGTLLGGKFLHFAAGQFAGADALADALVLVILAGIYAAVVGTSGQGGLGRRRGKGGRSDGMLRGGKPEKTGYSQLSGIRSPKGTFALPFTSQMTG